MDARFYRHQAALCQRLSQRLPQQRLADELSRLALEFETMAEELEHPELAEAQARSPLPAKRAR